MTYGWMGRTPDYKASLMNTLGANHQFYGKFADNAKAWYRRAQDHVLFMNHAIVNPPVDRAKAADQVKDVFITIQKETDAGIYVSGAKVVATSSALTHYNFLGQNAAMPTHDTDLAVMFIAPMNAPGVKLFCRTSYEMMASVMGTPFDYPLSSRFDENDAIFVFDNVLIPWEDVLLHRDLEKLKIFYPQSGFLARLSVPGLHAARGQARLPGRRHRQGAARDRRRRVPRQPGDARRDHRLAQPVLGADRRHGAQSDAVGRRRRAAERAVGLELPRVRRRRLWAHQGDRREDHRLGADLSAVLGQGFRESRRSTSISPSMCAARTASATSERIKIMKLLWDAIGTEFGGRHELYEMNYAGNHEDIRIQAMWNARGVGRLDGMIALADQCMAEYDENGWSGDTWLDPDDVAYPGLPLGRK